MCQIARLTGQSNDEIHIIDLGLKSCLASKAHPSTEEITDCITQATNKWEKEMNKNLSILRELLYPQRNGYRPGGKLLTLQREWRIYRNNEVAFAMQIQNKLGTTIQMPVAAKKKLELTKKRALELEEYISLINLKWSKDSIAWDNALLQNSIEGYKEYMQIFPEGKFHDEAQFWLSIDEENSTLRRKFENEDSIGYFKLRNVLFIEHDENDILLIRGDSIAFDDIHKYIKEFIANPTRRPEFAEQPEKAIIIFNNKGTLERYNHILKNIKESYYDLWDEYSFWKYGQSFVHLSSAQKNSVRMRVPYLLLQNVDINTFPSSLPPPPPPVIEEIPDH